MQLTKQESSAAFWAGAKQGALRSMGYVALAGAVLGIGMATVIPAGVISIGAAVLTGISTVLTVGMFSGHQALSNYHQQKHNALYEAKIARLEGREPQPEMEPHELVQSPRISTILDMGSRTEKSFAQAEEDRAAIPTSPTIH